MIDVTCRSHCRPSRKNTHHPLSPVKMARLLSNLREALLEARSAPTDTDGALVWPAVGAQLLAAVSHNHAVTGEAGALVAHVCTRQKVDRGSGRSFQEVEVYLENDSRQNGLSAFTLSRYLYNNNDKQASRESVYDAALVLLVEAEQGTGLDLSLAQIRSLPLPAAL